MSKDNKTKQIAGASLKELTEKEKQNVVTRLSPKMIRFVEIKVSTISLSDEQIASMLRVPVAEVKKWSKNPYVIEYMNQQKRTIFNQDYIDSMQRQHQELTEKAYLEYLSRFDEPDMNYHDRLPTQQQKNIYLARFAQNAEFKDLARAFVDLSKQTRSIMPDDLEGAQQTDIKEVIVKSKRRFAESRKQRMELEMAIQKGERTRGGGLSDLFLYNGQLDEPELLMPEDKGKNESQEIEVEQEVTIRQITINKSKKRNEGDDDGESR